MLEILNLLFFLIKSKYQCIHINSVNHACFFKCLALSSGASDAMHSCAHSNGNGIRISAYNLTDSHIFGNFCHLLNPPYISFFCIIYYFIYSVNDLIFHKILMIPAALHHFVSDLLYSERHASNTLCRFIARTDFIVVELVLLPNSHRT